MKLPNTKMHTGYFVCIYSDDLKYESKRRINNERHGNQNGRN